jgi:hypothetical protein
LIKIISTRYLLIYLITRKYLVDMILINLSSRAAWSTIFFNLGFLLIPKPPTLSSKIAYKRRLDAFKRFKKCKRGCSGRSTLETANAEIWKNRTRRYEVFPAQAIHMLLKIPATRTPQGALKFVALIIKILSCNKNFFFHGLQSKLPQLFYFNIL